MAPRGRDDLPAGGRTHDPDVLAVDGRADGECAPGVGLDPVLDGQALDKRLSHLTKTAFQRIRAVLSRAPAAGREGPGLMRFVSLMPVAVASAFVLAAPRIAPAAVPHNPSDPCARGG